MKFSSFLAIPILGLLSTQAVASGAVSFNYDDEFVYDKGGWSRYESRSQPDGSYWVEIGDSTYRFNPHEVAADGTIEVRSGDYYVGRKNWSDFAAFLAKKREMIRNAE